MLLDHYSTCQVFFNVEVLVEHVNAVKYDAPTRNFLLITNLQLT